MDNVMFGLIMAAILVAGFLSGGVLLSTETEIEGPIQYVDKEVVEYVEICGDICECPVCENKLQMAVDEFMKAVDNEEDEAENNVDALLDYDFDEISISKVYNEYSFTYDGDKTTVDFDIKLKYDEDDQKSEKHRYNVEVVFESEEDTLVTIK